MILRKDRVTTFCNFAIGTCQYFFSLLVINWHFLMRIQMHLKLGITAIGVHVDFFLSLCLSDTCCPAGLRRSAAGPVAIFHFFFMENLAASNDVPSPPLGCGATVFNLWPEVEWQVVRCLRECCNKCERTKMHVSVGSTCLAIVCYASKPLYSQGFPH